MFENCNTNIEFYHATVYVMLNEVTKAAKKKCINYCLRSVVFSRKI